jgi:hypothetical protein
MYAPNALGLAVGAGLIELVDYRPLLLTLGLTRLLTLLPLTRT